MPAEATRSDDSVSNLASALLLTLSILWCVYWFVHARHYWEDDAYIHLEFARSVAAGRGFAFNGCVVAGDTAPLWVLLLAAMHTLIPNWLAAGKVLTVFGAAFGLAGIYAFARSLAVQLPPTQLPFARLFPAAMVLLTVANPYFCYWLFSGMEPVAAVGLACFAALAATRSQPSTSSFLTACLLSGIAPLLRPEMLFLSALLILPLIHQGSRLPRASAKPLVLAAGLILLCAPLIAWSAYSLRAFGHILPNTNAAKRAAPNQSVVLHLLTIYSVGFPAIVCGLLAGIACLILRRSAVRRSIGAAVASAFHRAPEVSLQTSAALPLTGWIFILWPCIATVFYIANHTYVQTRYILVNAPELAVVIIFLFLKTSRIAGRVLYLVALIAAVFVSVVTVRPFLANKAANCEAVRNLALFLRDRIPPNAPVATYSIGEIAFVSQHPIIDTGGITRPGAIPYLNASPAAMLDWARDQGAQYAIAGDSPCPGAMAVYTDEFPFVGWTVHTSLYSTSGPGSLWKLPTTSDSQFRP